MNYLETFETTTYKHETEMTLEKFGGDVLINAVAGAVFAVGHVMGFFLLKKITEGGGSGG